MNNLVKSIVALAVLGGLLIFNTIHGSTASPAINSLAPKPTKNPSQNTAQNEPSDKVQPKKVEIKEVHATEVIPFQSITQNDSSLAKGLSKVTTKGVDGAKTIVYKATYVDGVETAREKISETVTTQPINQLTKTGTDVAAVITNPSGPAGATALCADGSFSYAEYRQGACSRHSGVSLWY